MRSQLCVTFNVLCVFYCYIIYNGVNALIREKRQAKILCLGNTFVTNFLNKLVDAQREALRTGPPFTINEGENIGILHLTNGTMRGLHNVFFNGEIEIDCDTDPKRVKMMVPAGLRNPVMQFSYTSPMTMYMLSGVVDMSFTLLGMNLTLIIGKDKKDGIKPTVLDCRFWSIEGFMMDLKGGGPATAALSLAFNMLARTAPFVIKEFMRSLLLRVFKKYLATAKLPL